MKKILFINTFILSASLACSQDTLSLQQQINSAKPGKTHFLFTGYAFSEFKFSEDGNSFLAGSFAPIFLVKPSDKVFFEAEIETEFEEGELMIELEYADINYSIAKNMTVRAGKFLLPFGTFAERLHPAWINRLPSKPLGFDHNGVGPFSDVGVELRGGLQTGKSKTNYAFYVVNGAVLDDGMNNSATAGMLMYENYEDNNKNKTIGGRIGFLPFSNSSLEIGISGQYGKVGTDKTIYENVFAQMFAADFSYMKSFEKLKSVIDIKGQINMVNVDKADYADTSAMGAYTFDNKNTAYYSQISLRPALSKNKIIQNIEAVARYSSITQPEKSLWAENAVQWDFGLNYWLGWRSVLKLAYQIHQPEMMKQENIFTVQMAIGL